MGEVWRAYDTATDRVVALKVLPEHLSQDEVFQQRFRREAHAAAGLNSPHVIPIHFYGEIDGRLFVDMRLIQGRDLQEVLSGGPLELGRAVRIIEQVARALHAAHQVGLVHRDVKPSNILLDADDYAYLIDFGIARAAGETGLTGTGGVIGSWPYMAPERFSAQEADARADVYALACVLYECLTGDTPYPGDSLEQQYAGHVATPPPRPSSTNPDLPADFDRVTDKGLAKDPDLRYATTIELADAARDAITIPLERPTPHPTRLPGAEPEPGPALLGQATQPATQQGPPGRPPVPQLRPDPPPPDTGTPPRRRWWRRGAIVIPAALVTVAVIAAAIVITSQQHENSNRPHREPAYGPQVTLPFTGLNSPYGVAVDAAGDLYVTDTQNNQVLELAAGSSTQGRLMFTGLKNPEGVAVDTAGDLYVADNGNGRVVKLAAQSRTTQTVLPFTRLNNPAYVAVDTAGNVYVADSSNNRVVKLAAGSSTPSVLPFTGLDEAGGVAVDAAGNLYVSDNANGRVLKLPAGSRTQAVLPFTGLNVPFGLAVDSAGNLYVTDSYNNRVLKLAAGSATQTVLPFTGLSFPAGVAVDAAGDVYVTDDRNNRVVKLPVV